jgi:glycosyltransferase involved in cell wall biosynthesis
MLTVIVPVSNMAGNLKNFNDFLAAGIRTGFNFIVVHDKQDELTGPELDDIVSKYSPSKVTLHEVKFGNPGDTRNYGIQYVETDWICFWDSDDEPIVENFSKMIELAEIDQKKIAIGWFQSIDHNHSDSKFEVIPFLRLDQVSRNPGIWRWAFKLERVGTARFPGIRMGEDSIFLARLRVDDCEIFRFEEIVYRYIRWSDNQLTQNYNAIQDLGHSISILQSTLKFQGNPANSFARKVLRRQIYSAIRHGKAKLKAKAVTSLVISFSDSLPVNRNKITSDNNSKNREITISASGGLGNQLFQISAGYYISKGENFNLDFRLSGGDSSILSEFLLPSEISLQKSLERPRFLQSVHNLGLRLSRFRSSGLLKMFASGTIEYILTVFLRKKVLVQGNASNPFVNDDFESKIYLIGYFQDYRYAIYSQPFIEKMILTSPSNYFQNELKDVLVDRPIIIHVRLGDYAKEKKFGIPTYEYFNQAFEYLKITDDKRKIWIFSNQPEIALSLLPESITTEIRIVRNDQLSTGETLELMKYGSDYIISNSTFSWWGAFLRKDKTARVIAPQPWFKSLPSSEHLCPEDWVRITI